MKRFTPIVLTFTAAIFCITGCGKKTETAPIKSAASYPLPEPPLVADCEPGIPGGRMVIGELGDPKTFNPTTSSEMSSRDVYRLLFSKLVEQDAPTQDVKPSLAESWTNSPDGMTWTFKLRKGLRWSDGEPLTADDVIFTWNDVIYNPKIDNVTRDAFIIGGKKLAVTKVDDLTIQVVAPEPFAPLLVQFGSGVEILPRHVLGKAVEDGTFTSAYGVNSDPAKVIGSGPYRLKECKPAQYTRLERNPYYFKVDKKGQRLPYFDTVIFTSVPNMNAVSLRFLSGESDAQDFVYSYEYEHFKAESQKGKFTVLEPGTGLEMSFFWFNQNTNMNAKTGKPIVDPAKLKWFRDAKFRQAVSYAIDRDSILKSVYSGRGVPAYGYESPGNVKWFNPSAQKFPYDVDKAKALLKEIGIEKRNGNDFATDAEGNPIEFVLNSNTGNAAREKVAVLIAHDLQELGFKVTFQPIEFNTLITKIDDTRDYECILMGLASTTTDPSGGMAVVKSDGYTHQWFPRQTKPSTEWEARLDHLMDEQNRTMDYAARKKIYDEVQAILAEQQPMIFTVTPTYYAAIRTDVGNVRPSPLTYYRGTWNLEELYYKK